MAHHQNLPARIANAQVFERCDGSDPDVLQAFPSLGPPRAEFVRIMKVASRDHLGNSRIRMASQDSEVALVDVFEHLGFEAEHAGENVAGLAGAQERARNQGRGFEVTREAYCEGLRLRASCFRQWDFIGVREMAAHVGLGLAVTNEDDTTGLLGLHAFRYTR